MLPIGRITLEGVLSLDLAELRLQGVIRQPIRPGRFSWTWTRGRQCTNAGLQVTDDQLAIEMDGMRECVNFMRTEAGWGGRRVVDDDRHAPVGVQGSEVPGKLLGFTLPKDVGGGDHSYLEFAIVLEELGRIGGGLWAFAYFSNLYGRIIDDAAFLRGLCSGQNVVAFAETEPQSGGDAAAIKTTAMREGGSYVINGRKHLISLIPGANWIIVTALTNRPAGGKRGMSMFLVKADQPGVKTVPIREPGMKSHMLGYVV